MATIVATPGASTANSFVTEQEADAYLADRLNAESWPSDDPIELIEATRELNYLAWQGSRSTSTQALAWPRTGVPNPDAPWDAEPGVWSGVPEYADNVIPTRLKEATIELALEFLRAGTTDITKPAPTTGVKRKVTGPLETEWFSPTAVPTGLSRYPRVLALIEPLLLSGSGQREVIRS